MRCDEAIRRIHEADPGELSPDGSTPLAGHLARCPRCRALARTVLEGQAALASVLKGWAAERPRRRDPEVGAAPHPTTYRRGARWWKWGGGSLAAAALLAALILIPTGNPDGRPAVITPAESGHAGEFRRRPLGEAPGQRRWAPSVEASHSAEAVARAGRSLTLVRTPNPKVTVVWLHPQSE